jgi:ring-1,2-phenylacetyl-CoA epoxidase subunit PaaC
VTTIGSGQEMGLEAVEHAEVLPAGPRGALRDLILTLADNKRLLGMRYSDRMLGSPSLETGIAAASMAQDEWGHARLTFALLSDFGDDPKQLEHGRESDEYHSMEWLDEPFPSWVSMIATGLLVDTALTLQYESLLGSRYQPARNRIQKLLDEEILHFQYCAGWVGRMARSGLRAELEAELRRCLVPALRWFGPPDAPSSATLLKHGLMTASPDSMRRAFLQRVAPVFEGAGLASILELARAGEEWLDAGGLEWEGWDERRRRLHPGGPDPETIARVRGDRNRAMLLD